MVVIDSETLEILSTLPASTIYESAGKLGDMAPSIRPLVHGARLFGQAFTVPG
jgi:regulator of RNase E activity RraA